MPVAVTDVGADLPLREDRIARDDAPLQRQRLEQHHRGRDLVLIGRNGEVADDRAQLCRKSLENMDGFVVEPPTAFQGLPVDGDMFGCALLKG